MHVLISNLLYPEGVPPATHEWAFSSLLLLNGNTILNHIWYHIWWFCFANNDQIIDCFSQGFHVISSTILGHISLVYV